MMMFESAWKKFVRPNRLMYTVFDLGPSFFTINDQSVTRMDLEITNQQGSILTACYFSVKGREGQQISDKVMIYCHGFNGCLVEAVKYAKITAELGINFCCFDFQAAGNSGGEFITLGDLEKHDIQSVITFLKNNFGIQQIVLWGRSLGATTILLHQLVYGSENVFGLVLDSPFQKLSKLAVRMARRQISMPKFIIKSLMALIRRQIIKNAHVDIDKISLSDQLINVSLPAYFISSKEDNVVPAKHTLKVMKAYKGSKQLMQLTGDHNEVRSIEQLRTIIYWAALQFKDSQQELKHQFSQRKEFQHYRSLSSFPQQDQSEKHQHMDTEQSPKYLSNHQYQNQNNIRNKSPQSPNWQQKISKKVTQPNINVTLPLDEIIINQQIDQTINVNEKHKKPDQVKTLTTLLKINKSATQIRTEVATKSTAQLNEKKQNKIFLEHQQKLTTPDLIVKSPAWIQKSKKIEKKEQAFKMPIFSTQIIYETPRMEEPQRSKLVQEKYSYLNVDRKSTQNEVFRTMEKYNPINRPSQWQNTVSYRGSLPLPQTGSFHAKLSYIQALEDSQLRISQNSNPAKNLKNEMLHHMRTSIIMNSKQDLDDNSRYKFSNSSFSQYQDLKLIQYN